MLRVKIIKLSLNFTATLAAWSPRGKNAWTSAVQEANTGVSGPEFATVTGATYCELKARTATLCGEWWLLFLFLLMSLFFSRR